MKKVALFSITLAVIALCLSGATSTAQQKRHRGFTINTGGDKPITNCGQITMRVDDWQVVRSEQERILPKAAVSALQVQSAYYGGIQVYGWERDQYAITACLGAASENVAEAQRLLSQLALSVQDGQVSVAGAGLDDTWMAYLIIYAPHGAALNLAAKNAPITVNSITANIEARNANGPITLRDVGGQVRAEVTNGPINISGNRGQHHLKVTNGPLNVALLGSRWENGEIEGSTQNGPIELRLPPNYQSPVRVHTSKHSPVECRAVQCQEAVRAEERPNVIEFGGANPVVRLSTINGPVAVRTLMNNR